MQYLKDAASRAVVFDRQGKQLREIELAGLGRHVRIHHDHGDPSKSFDLWPALEKPNTAHIYCCGPRPLMESVRDMTGHWSPGNVHFESFNEGGGVRPDDQPFKVRLARRISSLRLVS